VVGSALWVAKNFSKNITDSPSVKAWLVLEPFIDKVWRVMASETV
jgi:hypothetical protein